MINILASQLGALEGAIYVHFINESTFRAVYVPNIDLSTFDSLPLFRHPDQKSKEVIEQESDYCFEHAFYLLFAKITKNQSLRRSIEEKYRSEPIPGIGRITKVKTQIDAFLLSPSMSTSVAVYFCNGRVVVQAEWMGTRSEVPGSHAMLGYGETVNDAIGDVLKKEPLCRRCIVPEPDKKPKEKKEPVCY